MQANLKTLMEKYNMPSMTEAWMVVDLMNRVETESYTDYPLSVFVDAAKKYLTIEEAECSIIIECPICLMDLPIKEVRHYSIKCNNC